VAGGRGGGQFGVNPYTYGAPYYGPAYGPEATAKEKQICSGSNLGS